MKRTLLFILFILILTACGGKEESIIEDKVEDSPQIPVEAEEKQENVTIEAYLPTNELDAFGDVTILIVAKNHSDKEVTIDPGDFTLFTKEDSTEIGATTYDSRRSGDFPSEEFTLAPGEENYTFGYFDVADKKPNIPSIHSDEYILRYWGDIEINNSKIALNMEVPAEYEEQTVALMKDLEGYTDNRNTLEGLEITVYGPLDDEDAYVRVQNTSEQQIYFDADQLFVFDDVASYGVDPKVTDSAFDPTMHLQPGQIVDYREFFILNNHLDQDSSEIAENIKGVYYAPELEDETIHYGTYSHEDDLPQDFHDYD